jgi:hypothetical protein
MYNYNKKNGESEWIFKGDPLTLVLLPSTAPAIPFLPGLKGDRHSTATSPSEKHKTIGL